MKKYKERIIREKIYNLFEQDPIIHFIAPQHIKFTLQNINLNTKKLFALCKFFETDNIDTTETRISGGFCSTCEWTDVKLTFSVKPSEESYYLKV